MTVGEKKQQMANLPLIIQEQNVLVDARLLHQRLEITTKFTIWIARRIEEYDFKANLDYFPNLGNRKGSFGQPKKDYHLTLDMAKELAMLERNEIGRNIRRYFIAKEKEVRGNVKTQLPPVQGLFKGLAKQTINSRKLVAYKALLAKIGYKNSGGASTRVLRYPQHFVKFNNLLYITEEFATHLYHQKSVTQNRQVMQASQPVIPANFGQGNLFMGGVI